MQFLFLALSGNFFASILGIFLFRNLSFPYRLFVLQTLVALICQSAGYYIGTLRGQNNIWIFNGYILIESWLLLVASKYFLENFFLRKIVTVAPIAITVIWFAEILFSPEGTMANKFIITYSVLVVIIHIAILFQNALTTTFFFRSATTWLSLSCILYFACIIPYKSLENYILTKSHVLAESLFTILLIANFVRYPLVALSFYLQSKRPKKETLA